MTERTKTRYQDRYAPTHYLDETGPQKGIGLSVWERGEKTPKAIDYDGVVDSEKREAVRQLLTDTGIPLTYVEKVSHKPQPTDRPSLLATWSESKKELSFYERSDQMEPIGLLGLAVHEQWHSISPYKKGRETTYSSPEAQKQTAELGRRAANQALLSNKFLNGYHAYLAKQLHNTESKFNYKDFCEETLAIAAEMRINDPRGLEIKQKSQAEVLERIGDTELTYRRIGLFMQHGIDIQKPREVVDVKTGIENALVDVMPEIADREQLDAHIKRLREKYSNELGFS